MRELDPLLHSQLRLAIVSLLLSVETVDFVYLKEKTNATAGNLSVQLEKLETAGYIQIYYLVKYKRLDSPSLTKGGPKILFDIYNNYYSNSSLHGKRANMSH